jgi:hypothetical protein
MERLMHSSLTRVISCFGMLWLLGCAAGSVQAPTTPVQPADTGDIDTAAPSESGDTGPGAPSFDCPSLETCWSASWFTIRQVVTDFEPSNTGHDVAVLPGTVSRLVVGAPHGPGFVLGGSNFSNIAALELDGAPGWSLFFSHQAQYFVDPVPQASGANPFRVARMGSSVVLPGDVTGDGEEDVVALSDAPYAEVPGALLFPGPVPDFDTVEINQNDPSVVSGDLDVFDGARCGDLTGDGIAELVVDDGIVVGPIGETEPNPFARDVPLQGRVFEIDDRAEPGCLWADGGAVHLLTSVDAGALVTTTLFTTSGDPAAMHAVEGTGGEMMTAIALTEGGTHRVEIRETVSSTPTTIPIVDPPRSVLMVDLDGDAQSEVLVGTTTTLHVFDAQGTVRGTWAIDGADEPPGFRLLLADVQLGPDKELILSAPWANNEGLVFVFPLPLEPQP